MTFDVQLVGYTNFVPPKLPGTPEDAHGWSTDATGGVALAEFAGRACYESFDKPNPKTATNEGYLRNILDVGHYSVLEHGSASFYITGVSRSFTHELVRHRHLSYSQVSQRYVNQSGRGMVIPPELANLFEGMGPEADEVTRILDEVMDTSKAAYIRLMEILHHDRPGMSSLARRKAARGAARAVLPEMTETRIVVTGNYRAWRHFIDMRATAAADIEIRQVAAVILRNLQHIAYGAFQDYELITLPDGSEAAESNLGAEKS